MTRDVTRVFSAVLILTFVTSQALATPFSLRSQFAPNQGAMQPRNIRNLECVSRKTQEKGICMFALSCLKLNGTHLGVCVDRFYYGSCCKLPETQEDLDLGAGDSNDINSAGNVLGLPGKRPVTAASVAEEDPSTTEKPVQTTRKPAVTSKPTVTSKPPVTSKPVVTQRPVTSAAAATTAKPTVKPVAATTQKPVTQKPTTKRPTTPVRPVTASKPSNTTARPVTKPTVKPAATTQKPPVKPVTTPPKPVSSPPKPVSSPPKPVSSPPKPVSSPPKPATQPPKPVTQPPKPVTQPPKPASQPPKPTTQPPKPTTQRPSTSPPKPATSPSKPVSPPSKPVTSPPKPSTAKPPPKPATSPSKPTTQPPKPAATKPPPKPAATTVKPVPTTTLSNEVAPSSIRPSQVPVVEAVEEDTNSVSGTQPSITIKPTPPTFPSASTSRPTPPTFPRPSSTVKPAPTTLPPSTTVTDGGDWVQVEVSTTSSATTPGASVFSPGSMVTEEIPTSSSSSSTSGSSPSLTSTTTEVPDEPSSLNMSDYKQVCGRRLIPDGRIVGGTRSSFGKWPWQISLRQWRTSTYLHKCGAALLNENWAITAAHCVENVPPSDLLLRLGEHDLSTESEAYSHLERRVQIVASHPQFDSRTFEYDLALLRFYEPVEFKPNVVPICIPDNDKNFVGSNAFVTGWGRLYEDGPLPSVMQEVSVPVIENAQCETMYRSAGYIEHIPNIFICAGWKKGGFDSCEGDSGGPMVIQRDDKRWTLAGVISWGIGCAEPNQPGVYTRISEFRDWINQILQF